jgi:ABC-type dipeptide/oligopeptide/nickel transport system permease component
MLSFLARRLTYGLVVVAGVVFVLALLVKLVPGDVVEVMAVGNPGFTAADAARLREELGVNRSVPAQFVHYAGMLLRGDLGESFRHRRPVWELLRERLPATLELTLVAMGLAIGIALPLGMLTALRPGTALDYGGTVFSVLGVATPGFLVGILLILVFTIELNWLPPSGRKGSFIAAAGEALVRRDAGVFWASFRYYVMPALALALVAAAINARLIRSAVLEVMRQDFVLFAKAKGLPPRVVYRDHILRNALIPTVTIMGLQLGFLISGAFIIETVFAWPGIGRLAVEAVHWRDYPLIQGTVLLSSIMFLALSLAVDVLYRVLDPRIAYGRR